MGNSLGCSASGERLVSAARDGDLAEAKMLLEFNPCLAKYSTFGGLNSPLHFAAAKGHSDACRYGHWEVVQALLLHRGSVTRTDYLNGRTALHFAAVDGHVRCIRLLVADFAPSQTFRSTDDQDNDSISGSGNSSSPFGQKYDQHTLSKFVNKQADGGVTALHMSALNGHFDCVQLLLDLNANVSAVTLQYGSFVNLIGAGSTPLHYAACGGNLKCCQVLLARGASRVRLNCNGWLPADVARIWGRHWLEPLLAPNSNVVLPAYQPSNYLSLPLKSILDIARESELQSLVTPSDDLDVCAVCLERTCSVAAEGCGHEFCTKCALCLCSSSTSILTSDVVVRPGTIPCPLCRQGIISFVKLPSVPVKGLKLKLALSLCNPCLLHSRDTNVPTSSCQSHIPMNHDTSDSSEITCPVSCSPFPSVSLPLCACDDGPTACLDTEGEAHNQSSLSSPLQSNGKDKQERQVLEKTNCSKMFWNRRSCHREQQCNAEINL